jgi:hypothetical protein
LIKYAGDAEIMKMGLTACRSMVSVSTENSFDLTETVKLSIALLQGLLGEGDATVTAAADGLSAGDRNALTSDSIEYLLLLSKRAPEAMPEEEISRLISIICNKLSKTLAKAATPAIGAENAAAKLTLSRTVFNLVAAIGSNRDGLIGLSKNQSLLAQLILAVSVVHKDALVVPTAAAMNANVNTKSIKIAFDPILRVIDRMSRLTEGIDVLVSCQAGPLLTPVADWWTSTVDESAAEVKTAAAVTTSKDAAEAAANSAFAGVLTPAAVVDLMNRLVGDTIGDLITSLTKSADLATAQGQPAWVGKQRSARLLAKLCNIPERATALAKDKTQCVKVVDLLQVSIDSYFEMIALPVLELEIAVSELSTILSLLQLLCRVGERPGSASVSGLQMILDSGVLWACLTALEAVDEENMKNPDLNVLQTAVGAAAYRLLAFLISAGYDADVSYHGYVLEEVNGPDNRTVLESALGRSEGALLRSLTAHLRAPITAVPESSLFLSQLARLTYASTLAKELLMLAVAGSAVVVEQLEEASISVHPVSKGKLLDASSALLTSLGVATATAGRVLAEQRSQPSTAADRPQWTWMVSAAAGFAIEATFIACGSELATMTIIESGALSGLLSILTGKASGGATSSGPVKKGLVRQISGVTIGGVPASYAWVRAILREQPTFIEAAGHVSSSPKFVARALSFAASIVTLLSQYAPSEDDDSASSEAVETPLSALALDRATFIVKRHGDDAQTPMTTREKVRACIDTILESCLSAYATHPSDMNVYEAFKEVVDEASVSVNELLRAVTGLRGVSAALRECLADNKLVTAAVRTSAAIPVIANISNALKNIDVPLSNTSMHKLETNPSDSGLINDINTSLAQVRTIVPSSTIFLSQVHQLLGIARKHLLLLEAASLSPMLSWALCYMNGLYPLLKLLGSLSALGVMHCDMIDISGATVKTSTLASRIDDLASHCCVVLSGVARIAYDVRASNGYDVDFGSNKSEIPEHLDKRLLGEQLFSTNMASIIFSTVNLFASTGIRLPLFVNASVPLCGWLACAVNLPSPPGDDEWGERFLASLLNNGFVEASVSFLRLSLTYAIKAEEVSKSGGLKLSPSTDADESATEQAAARINFDLVSSVVSNLQHIGIHASGAMQVVTRGASRQLMKGIPALTAACGSNQTHSAYRALLKILNFLNICVAAEDEEGAAVAPADENSGSGTTSTSRLLYKQGLVDSMLQVAFSGVGISATSSEASTVALSIVSAVSGRQDVKNALKKLKEISENIANGSNAFVAASAPEIEGWRAIAAQGNTAKVAPTAKHAVFVADGLDAAESNESQDEKERQSGSQILAALQIFGLLITTEAGRHIGIDTVAVGVTACADILLAASSYLSTVSKVQDSVLAAAAAITASTSDDKPAQALPMAISSAANAALAAPSRAEKDLVWSILTTCQVIRVTLNVMESVSQSEADEAKARGKSSSSSIDSLSVKASANSDSELFKCMSSAVTAAVATLEVVSQTALTRLGLVTSGTNLLGSISGASGKGGRGAISAAAPSSKSSGASIPTTSMVVIESTSTLAALSKFNVCAEELAAKERSLGIVLSTIDSARDKKLLQGEEDIDLEACTLVTLCNLLSVVNGVATSSPENATALVDLHATDKILSVFGEVTQAATKPQSSHSTFTTNDAILGVGSALESLSAFATSAEIDKMLDGGLISFIKSASTVLPESVPESFLSAHGAPTKKSLSLTSKGLSSLVHKLTTDGALLNGEESDDASISGETLYSASLREIVVHICVSTSNVSLVYESLPAVQSTLQLVMTTASASQYVPQASADRTLAAIRVAASNLAVIAKKSMSTSGAPFELLSLGRKVISLLKGGDKPEEGKTPGAKEEDELQIAINDLTKAVNKLDGSVGLSVGPPPPSPITPGATSPKSPPLLTFANVSDEKAQQTESAANEVLESLLSLALLVNQMFPMSVSTDGSELLDAADIADQKTLSQSLGERSVATFQAFLSIKRTIIHVSSILISDRNRLSISKKSQAACFDILSASMPLVSRFAVFAEDERADLLLRYYAGEVTEWELNQDDDVPLVEALTSISAVMDAHICPADSVLSAAVTTDVTPQSLAVLGSYSLSASAIETICRAIRVIITGCGKDALSALSSVGTFPSMLRLVSTIRRLRDQALAGLLEGGREKGRLIVAECDKAITAINGTAKTLIDKGQNEIISYCHVQKDQKNTEHIETILTPQAIADLLRAATTLATQAAASEAKNESENTISDAEKALAKHAEALVNADGGVDASWTVLDTLSASVLGAVSAVDTGDGASDVRDNVRLYSGMLQALQKRNDEKGVKEVPANAKVVRSLYAAIASSMQVLSGDTYAEAMQATQAMQVARDAASEEFEDKEKLNILESDSSIWTRPGGKIQRVDASAEEVEEF